jgi:hypothetical protein
MAANLQSIKANGSAYTMLLSSILSILDKNQNEQVHPKIADKPETAYGPYKIYAEAARNLEPEIETLQMKQEPEAGPLKPILQTHGPPSTSIHDLIKAVAKFEKTAPKRVLDVFH